MFVHEVLRWLVVLAVCHGLAAGYYFPVQRRMSWVEAREFCQRHYVDLAVLSTEEQYLTLFNATSANKMSFWLGLQRQSIFSVWKWVTGEELGYERWYRRNYEGRCASLEAMLQKEKKLLARYCAEPHMVVCQGPVSPQSVTVDSVGADHVKLSWNVSSFMQMTPHSYNVTTCTRSCETRLHSYTAGSTLMTIHISNLSSATKYFIQVSAVVIRPDNKTGRKMILQNAPTTLRVKTEDSFDPGIILSALLKFLKLVPVVPLLWLFCSVLRIKGFMKSDDDVSIVELSADATVVDLKHPMSRATG